MLIGIVEMQQLKLKLEYFREETDYRFEIILYMHRIFQMFEFSAPGGYLISKEIALLTLFCFCWPKCP